MRRATIVLAGWIGLFATAALADCVRPRPSFEIPDGSSATDQEMLAAQRQLVAFDAQVGDYLGCLSGEASQKSVGKDVQAREDIARAHLQAHNEAADEVSGLASCFNAQLASFKSTGGGTQRRAADCSAYFAAAANPGRAATPATTELVVEASGHSFEVPSGSWIYYLVRNDTPVRCTAQDASLCLYRAVHVRNTSDEVLECHAEIGYDGADVRGNAATKFRALVPERTTRVIVESLAKQEINAKIFDAQCTPRAKLPPLETPKSCKYEVVQPVAIADYYPPASRTAGEEGPVVVEFTLRGAAARPTDVRVVSGSMFESLDQAAVKAVGDMVMSSSCPKARYRLKLSFQLQQ